MGDMRYDRSLIWFVLRALCYAHTSVSTTSDEAGAEVGAFYKDCVPEGEY